MNYDGDIPYVSIDDHAVSRLVTFAPMTKKVERWSALSDTVKSLRSRIRCLFRPTALPSRGRSSLPAKRYEVDCEPIEEVARPRGAGFYFIAGLAVLMPFNVTILTFDHFSAFPGWPYQCMVAYCLPLFISQVIGQRYPPQTTWKPLGCLAFACLILPVILKLNIPVPVCHVVALLAVSVMAISCAASQLATFGRAAKDNHGLAISIGTGLAGPVTALGGHSMDGYIIAAAITLLCAYWSEYDSMFDTPIDTLPTFALSSGTVSTASTASTGSASPCSINEEEEKPKMWAFALTMFFTYLVSGFCFPAMIQHWIPGVVMFYQVWDFIGRCIPMICQIPWCVGPPMALIRALFVIPLLVVALPPLMTYELKLLLLASFAFSNGFLTSLIFAQSAASPTLGRLLSLSICFGLTAGSILAMIVARSKTVVVTYY